MVFGDMIIMSHDYVRIQRRAIERAPPMLRRERINRLSGENLCYKEGTISSTPHLC
jgi:hypothetical protein